jgi:hypothetical protein
LRSTRENRIPKRPVAGRQSGNTTGVEYETHLTGDRHDSIAGQEQQDAKKEAIQEISFGRHQENQTETIETNPDKTGQIDQTRQKTSGSGQKSKSGQEHEKAGEEADAPERRKTCGLEGESQTKGANLKAAGCDRGTPAF